MRSINRVLTLNRSCRVLVHPEKLLELPGRASFRSIALTHTLHANETIPPGFSRFRASLCILRQTTILLWFIRASSFGSNSFVTRPFRIVGRKSRAVPSFPSCVYAPLSPRARATDILRANLSQCVRKRPHCRCSTVSP